MSSYKAGSNAANQPLSSGQKASGQGLNITTNTNSNTITKSNQSGGSWVWGLSNMLLSNQGNKSVSNETVGNLSNTSGLKATPILPTNVKDFSNVICDSSTATQEEGVQEESLISLLATIGKEVDDFLEARFWKLKFLEPFLTWSLVIFADFVFNFPIEWLVFAFLSLMCLFRVYHQTSIRTLIGFFALVIFYDSISYISFMWLLNPEWLPIFVNMIVFGYIVCSMNGFYVSSWTIWSLIMFLDLFVRDLTSPDNDLVRALLIHCAGYGVLLNVFQLYLIVFSSQSPTSQNIVTVPTGAQPPSTLTETEEKLEICIHSILSTSIELSWKPKQIPADSIQQVDIEKGEHQETDEPFFFTVAKLITIPSKEGSSHIDTENKKREKDATSSHLPNSHKNKTHELTINVNGAKYHDIKTDLLDPHRITIEKLSPSTKYEIEIVHSLGGSNSVGRTQLRTLEEALQKLAPNPEDIQELQKFETKDLSVRRYHTLKNDIEVEKNHKKEMQLNLKKIKKDYQKLETSLKTEMLSIKNSLLKDETKEKREKQRSTFLSEQIKQLEASNVEMEEEIQEIQRENVRLADQIVKLSGELELQREALKRSEKVFSKANEVHQKTVSEVEKESIRILKETTEKQSEVDVIQNELSAIESESTNIDSQVTELQTRKEQLEKKLEALRNEYSIAESQNQENLQQITRMIETMDTKNSQLKETLLEEQRFQQRLVLELERLRPSSARRK